MPRLKKCPDCGGKMEKGETEFLAEFEQGLIAIENIDADICTICGAKYLPAESDKYVENHQKCLNMLEKEFYPPEDMIRTELVKSVKNAYNEKGIEFKNTSELGAYLDNLAC